jgi:hypothetical protein
MKVAQPLGRRRQQRLRNPVVAGVRCCAEWEEWLIRFAAHRRVPLAVLIDQALAEAAARDGFPAPPQRLAS